MRALYISKASPKPPCLIAKIKLGVSVHGGTLYPTPTLGSIRPLALGIGYTVAQCLDTPNFIFAIKHGGLDKTFDV